MKFAIAVALCCAAQVFGLGMPNYLLPQTTFNTIPPWQYVTSGLGLGIQNLEGGATFSFVVPPSFASTNRQYRRVFDDQNDVEYIPINNYVLLTNADLSSVTPRAKVLAVGPNVTRLHSERHIGSTVAHPALTTDSFPSYALQFSLTSAGTVPIPSSTWSSYAVQPGQCYAWTGGSLDWNMFIYSDIDQVFNSHWMATLDQADQSTGGVTVTPYLLGGGFTDRTVDVSDAVVLNPTSTAANYYPQTWIRSSPQSDGVYFCQDTALLGEVSVQSGDVRQFYKNVPKTHIAYGGFRPNHYFNSGCSRASRLGSQLDPAFFGPCALTS